MNVYLKAIFGILMFAYLVGCGGSSNNSDEIPTKTQIRGIAVDDLIVNGLVSVYSTSTPPVLLDKVRTDENNGSYSLNIDYDGVVILEVTCDALSQMKSPNTGVKQSCEDDLSLKSAATLSPDLKDIEVNISPVSHLVVQQMKERAGDEEISNEDLELSQDNIGQIFGFDPLGDSPTLNSTYSNTVVSIRELADDKNISMMEVLDLVNEDTKDGESGDDGDVSKELSSVMQENDVKNTFTENNGSVVPTNAIITPVPTATPTPAVPTATPTPAVPTATPIPAVPTETPTPAVPTATPTPTVETDIAVSKAFFNDLRTQAMSVVDYDETGTPGFLDTESENLGKDLENMTLNIGLAAEYSVGIIGLITEAIDENLDNKKIEIDNLNENNSDGDSQNSILLRTLEVIKTADSKIWTYTIEDNTSDIYSGIVTLPDANISSITASNFTTLLAKFEGKLPLRDINSTELAGEQTVKLDLEVNKSVEGADIELRELSIKTGTDSVTVKTLKGQVDYEHDTETDEVTIASVQLETITFEATLKNYILNGKLDIEYAVNNSVAEKGFSEETNEYKTRIYGNVMCAGLHNEWVASSNGQMDGNVIYKDQSNEEHTITLNSYGSFYDEIEGNVQNLEEGQEIREEAYSSNDYNNYLGLNFDNITLSSEQCSNITLDNLNISTYKNLDDNSTSTYIQLDIFCVDTDGNKSDITNATGTFTDALGVSHTFVKNEYDENRWNVSYEGNSEGITFDSGHTHFETFDRVTISNVNSECLNPSLEYLDIHFSPSWDKTSTTTDLQGKVICEDDTYASEANITYTDKSNQMHNLIYDEEGKWFHSDWNNPIEGNVEELPLNSGQKDYHAIGWVLPTTPMFSVTESSCENVKFDRYDIEMQSDQNNNIYNSGVVPKKAKFVGSIKNTTTSGEINGEVNVDWKNSETMDLTKDSNDTAEIAVTLKGKIKMPNRPEMILNLGFENQEANKNYTLSYQYGTTVLNGTANFDNEEDTNGTVEFTGTSGIKLLVKVENGDVVYGTDSPVTRNARKIGELQEREGVPVIKYVDGSFESLP